MNVLRRIPPPLPRQALQFERAIAFLLHILREKTPVPAARIRAEGDAQDINWFTIRQARKRLPIILRKRPTGWTWQYMPGDPAPADEVTP